MARTIRHAHAGRTLGYRAPSGEYTHLQSYNPRKVEAIGRRRTVRVQAIASNLAEWEI